LAPPIIFGDPPSDQSNKLTPSPPMLGIRRKMEKIKR